MHLCESTLPSTFVDHSASLMARILLLLVLLLCAPFFAGCRTSNPPAAIPSVASAATDASITLSSDSLAGGTVPKEFTCDGADQSPPLKWTAPPADTKSFILTVTDPDAPGGTFTHWVVFNLPANTSALAAGVPTQDQLPDGSRQGRNDFGKVGYGGPCPPRGSTHRYFFDLFALNSTLVLPARATRAQIEDAMNTHVLARGKLMARYGR
ncbi:MAG: YbhB/YbcL family Raf kinase inhibitor-like protein [Terracidiphilus sp.]